MTDHYGVSPDKIVTITNEVGEVITWYLMNVQITNESGEILWADLTEKEYYLLELRAPDGYKLNHNGQVIEAPESGTGTKPIIVTNDPGYKLPKTGGAGTMGFYISGALLIGTAFLLFPIKRRKTHR